MKKDLKLLTPKSLMLGILIFTQAIWNPIILTLSNLQIYLSSLLLLLFWAIKLFIRKGNISNSQTSGSTFILLVLGYFLIFLLSVLVNGLNQYAISNFARVCTLLLMIKFIQYFEYDFHRFLNFYFLLNICLCFWLLQKFLVNGVDISNRISPVGQGSANCFGATLAIVSLLRISWCKSYLSSQNRLVYFVGLPITFITILATYSRGASLGLILGIFLIGIQRIRLRQIPKILGFFSTILILSEMLSFSNSPILARYSLSSFHDSSGRNIIFRNALNAISVNPLFGAGVSSKLNPFESGEASTHNVFLQVAGETGMIGLFYLILVLAILMSKYRPKLTLPALGCLFMVSLTDNHFLAVQFQLTIGLIFLSLLQERHDSQNRVGCEGLEPPTR